MNFRFTSADIARLERVLGVRSFPMGSYHRFEIAPTDPVRKTALEVYRSIPIGKKKGALVSVYTPGSHVQLHFCTGMVVSEVLGEVTFIAEEKGKVSGLIVERQGGCSLFANVDRSIVSGDFTKLGPEVMLSGIALSLTEPALESKAPARTPRRRKQGAKRASRS